MKALRLLPARDIPRNAGSLGLPSGVARWHDVMSIDRNRLTGAARDRPGRGDKVGGIYWI